MREIDFAGIDGVEVGHAQDPAAATGCTVVICREGATAGVDVRGGAPGTRETDLLNPVNLVQKIFAVMLAGGSAFGRAAAACVRHCGYVSSADTPETCLGALEADPGRVMSPIWAVSRRERSSKFILSSSLRRLLAVP